MIFTYNTMCDILHIIYCTMYTVHCTLHNVHYTCMYTPRPRDIYSLCKYKLNKQCPSCPILQLYLWAETKLIFDRNLMRPLIFNNSENRSFAIVDHYFIFISRRNVLYDHVFTCYTHLE